MIPVKHDSFFGWYWLKVGYIKVKDCLLQIFDTCVSESKVLCRDKEDQTINAKLKSPSRKNELCSALAHFTNFTSILVLVASRFLLN